MLKSFIVAMSRNRIAKLPLVLTTHQGCGCATRELSALSCSANSDPVKTSANWCRTSIAPLVSATQNAKGLHTQQILMQKVTSVKEVPLLRLKQNSQSVYRNNQSCRSRYTDSKDEDLLEEEDSDDFDSQVNESQFEEDEDFPSNYRELKVHLKSMRLDAVISAGLNMARNKTDEEFLASRLRHNGDRVLKKSKKVSVGDYIDLVTGVEEDVCRVKRVRVLGVDGSGRTSKDKLRVYLRAWRSNVSIPKPTEQRPGKRR